MSNLKHHNSNHSSKKTILGLSRTLSRKSSSNTNKVPSRSKSELLRSKSTQHSRLESIPPSRSESEMRFLTESSNNNDESGKNKIKSGNQLLFDNPDNILYPSNNNKLNDITDIDYNSNNTELSNISMQLVNECINWASQYHFASPYLYEISIREDKVYNNTVNTLLKKIKFKLYKGKIDEFYVPRENKFNITVLIIIMFTIYLLKNDINNNTVFSSILDYVNNRDYRDEISKLINVNSYKLSDEYKLYFYNSFIKKSLYAYKTANEFYDLGGHAYISSLHGGLLTDSNEYELFLKVPKNVKIGFLAPLETYGMVTINNRNIYYLSRDIGLKNILTLGPNYYQNINNNTPSELTNMNIYHEGQLVPNLMLSFSCNVVVTNTNLDLNQNKYMNYIKYTNKLKLYDDKTKAIYLNDITQYIYKKLIRYFIKGEYKKEKKPKSKKLHTKNIFTNNGVRYKYIYIEYDKIHFYHNMIIQNISTFNPEIFTELTKHTVTEKSKTIFKDYLNMADKTINILSKFDLNISLLSNENSIYTYKFELSLPMNKYINIIDSELKNYKKANTTNRHIPGGNLYVFNSCRFYNTTVNDYYNTNYYENIPNITKQLAMTYITDITNKYVSSLVNKKPDKVKYKLFAKSNFDHSLNNTMIYNAASATYYSNKQYSSLTLNLSKDFLILFAISNIIINSKTIKIDHTKNSDILKNIKIALYNLFIKPRFDVKELTPYTISKLKIYTQKSEPGIKPNNTHKISRKPRTEPKYPNSKKKVLIVNEINSILYSKITPSYGYLKVLLNNIVYFLIQYYLPYIKWIYNNHVIYIDYSDYNPIDSIVLNYYPLIYHPVNNYFNKSKHKHTT